jgi:hypothetical protein
MVIYFIPKPLAAPITQKSTVSLWYLPREIRDMIYCYLFDIPCTGVKSFIELRPFNAERISNISLLKTSSQVYEETLDLIVRRCTIEFVINGGKWSEFEIRLLHTARWIKVTYDTRNDAYIPRHSTKLALLVQILEGRSDIREFHFRGEGTRILPHLHNGHPGFSYHGQERSISILNFRRIMKILEIFVKIRTRTSLIIGWIGDENLPRAKEGQEDDIWNWNDILPGDGAAYILEYRQLLARAGRK